MAYTDAMSIACKSLGFGHNVWFSSDKTKYTMDDNSTPAAKPKKDEPKAEAKTEIKAEAKAKPEIKPEFVDEVPSEHTPDTATIIDEIAKRLDEVGKGMERAEKLAFAKNNILPIIGSMNYKSCTDITKLIALRDKLSA